MTFTFKNPLAVDRIKQLIDALPGEFSFGWSIKLKQPLPVAVWHRHFDQTLNHLFVSDNPKAIIERNLPPVRWYAIREITNDSTLVFHGHAKVPYPNLCGSGLTSGMCRPIRMFLQSAMRCAGFDCRVALVHAGAIINNKKYQRQWQADVNGALWDYIGEPHHGGVHRLGSQRQFTSIVSEAQPIGMDLLFGETQP